MPKQPLEAIIASELHDSQWRTHAPIDFLLGLGAIVASGDFAVEHFYDPWHPKFFGNRSAVMHAVNRGIEHHTQSSNAITVNRITSLCSQWTLRWPAEPSDDASAQTIRDGLRDLQMALQALTPEGADQVCQSIRQGFEAAEDREDEEYYSLGDHFLQSLGYMRIDEEEDSRWIPPNDLLDRLRHLKPIDLCVIGDHLRVAWHWPTPPWPRSDYARIAQGIRQRFHSLENSP